MHKLRTVDIWDTLLRRNCHPEAVKLATAQHMFLRFHRSLADGYVDHWQLYRERLRIEHAMGGGAQAAGHDAEYELTAVLRHCLENVLAQPQPDDLEEVAQDIAGHEFAFEMANTFPDGDIAGFMARHPAEKTLYLSDFYMTGAMMDRLLIHHGLDGLAPSGLVSCDVMRNKRSGQLFKHVQDINGVTPQEHIHIGDNPYSDVETPRRLGIGAMSFLPEEGHKARMAREELFRSRDALFAHLHEKVEESARERAPSRDADAEAMFRLGLQAAPLFIGFALFIAERAIMDRLDRLLFLTREGEFFFRLFQTLFPEDRHAGHSLPPCAILAASRYATFTASIEAVSVEEFNRIWNLNWQQKLSTLFGILRIEPQAFSRLLAHLGLSPEELIVRPQEDRRIKELLANKDFIEAVRSSAQEERSQLIAYLQQQGVEPGERIGFVDIGWRGTIQDNLARIVPECETTGYYLALRVFLNPQPPNAIKYSFGLDERFQDTGRFFESFEPLELLCNSPNGSVCNYRRDETGQVVPVREVNKDENAMFERFTRHFQDGVALAAETWRPLLANHAVMADEMRVMALRVWDGLAAQPPEALIQAYYGAPQHDIFGFGSFFDRRKAPTLATLFLALINRQRRGVVTQYIRRTQWMPALAGLEISPLHRFALTTVFWLALKYKRFVILRRNKPSR